jgi:hypothetical protein
MTMCYVIFVIFALFQTTMALEIATVDADDAVDVVDAQSINMKLTLNDTFPNFAVGELRPRGEGSLGKQFTDLIAEYVAGKITSPELAETFVAEIYSAICSHFAGLVLTTTVFAEVGQFVEYATLVFDTIALPAGPAGWLIAFAFTVALNVLVSEVFPQLDEIVKQACEQPKPCSDDFANDANNCGRCGNVVCYSNFICIMIEDLVTNGKTSVHRASARTARVFPTAAQERRARLLLPAAREAPVSAPARRKALASVLMEAPHALGFRPARRVVIALLGRFALLHLAV